jgi:putative transposase
MIKSIKVMLIPNNKQITKLFKYANTARFAYNWTIAREQENYKQGNKFLSDNDLRKEFTQLKKKEEYKWLNDVSNNIPKQAIKDACNTYKRFFKGQCKYPKFKSRKKSPPKFYQDNIKIQFTSTHVKFEGFSVSKKQNKQKLNWVKLSEYNRIPYGENVKYSNPRISFDGINWFISVGIEDNSVIQQPFNQGIGIDLGIKDLAICSDGNTYKNINKTKEVKRLEKKKRRLQRKVSRKYIMNKEGSSYKKTRNIIKSEKQLLKLNHKLTNIRHNYIHQTTSEIIKRKPSFIVLEDLNISGMMKNKHLSKAIQQQSLYEFTRILSYKCQWNCIELRQVDRFYPSSKTCHACGYINKNLKLSDRVYICPECGNVEDRDYNASLNLRDATEYKIVA